MGVIPIPAIRSSYSNSVYPEVYLLMHALIHIVGYAIAYLRSIYSYLAVTKGIKNLYSYRPVDTEELEEHPYLSILPPMCNDTDHIHD